MNTINKKPAPFTLTIDWEDFGQLFCKYIDGEITAPIPKTIDRQTDIILQMLDNVNVKATFFILGMLAEYRPDLVKKIAKEGHEIALHGMSHEAMFKLTPEKAKKDLSDSTNLISDVIGQPILGYRAPFFSILRDNLYVLDVLFELGFQYDSSIFPTKMPRYGIDNFDTRDKFYKLPNGGEIVELPLTVMDFAGKKWPISGGGYMRIMPMFLLKKIYSALWKKNKDCMIYMHPYEFDTHKIDVSSNLIDTKNISSAKVLMLNYRWNFLRSSIRAKMDFLLTNYSFSTCLEKSNYVKHNSYSPTILG